MNKFLLIALLFTCSCSQNWSYKNPEKWGDLGHKNRFCKLGYNQSPINITEKFEKLELAFKYQKSAVSKEKKDNLLKVNFHNRSFISLGRKEYFLRDLSFHHPSEHLVEGNQHSLEMQISHKSDDEQWLILAVFLEVGNESADFSKLVKFITSNQKEGKINLTNLLNSKDLAFFYDGSFTTPPCKEGVKWYVMKTPLKISKDQMNKIIKSAIFVKSNARPVQEFHPEKY